MATASGGRLGPTEYPPLGMDVWRTTAPVSLPDLALTKSVPSIVAGFNPAPLDRASTSAKMRILKLEKSLAWLQEQHTRMLSDLHTEIETLKNKNRELQFQLIMSGADLETMKTGELVSRKITELSKKQIGADLGKDINSILKDKEGLVTSYPLQIEILDNEMKTLQSSLLEARSRNLYLENIVEQQRRKLERLESERVEESAVERSVNMEPPPELLRKLAEAEDLLSRMREENQIQREELEDLKNTMAKELRMKFRGCNHPVKSRLNAGGRSSSTTRLDLSVDKFPSLLKPVSVTPRRSSRTMGPLSRQDTAPEQDTQNNKQRIYAALPSLPVNPASNQRFYLGTASRLYR